MRAILIVVVVLMAVAATVTLMAIALRADLEITAAATLLPGARFSLVLPAAFLLVATFVTATTFEASDARLRLIEPHVRLPRIDVAVVHVFVAVVLTVDKIAGRLRTTNHAALDVTALLHVLLAEGHDDAVVVLCVLQIILGEHRIARRLGIMSQRNVLLRNVRGSTPDFHIRTVALETASQRILALAIASATTAVLLSLPHGLPFSIMPTLGGRPDTA